MRDKQTGELVAVKFIERGEKVGHATSLEPLHLESAGIHPGVLSVCAALIDCFDAICTDR